MSLSNVSVKLSHLPNPVIDMLHTLLLNMQEAIGDELIGVYLRGSLALGDFDPVTSDLDFVAVTKFPVSDEKFAVLNELHTQLATIPNAYAQQLEGAYIEHNSLKRFRTGERHPTLEREGFLRWNEHHTNWILERWTLRERGITLIGPDPKTLIEPISKEDILSAVSMRMRDWVNFANQLDDPDWRSPLGHKAYVVETMCRIMYTLDCGVICSKPHAVSWALKTFPEPWRSLVERSRSWRTDNRTSPDSFIISEVMRFVHWVASHFTYDK
ncbi:aminoglycoside adenylyltransferase domain-containing protein [Paenibacillus qinlingensis]|uniref:Adenylyltransferase AadA C-terminal domain-containing protein n=1 Tax=Paenibacillus qinlingensis TaxID=1837343 RepID=A0ABU1NT57_9BACL|nr:aminoglycoside adenylyltransferase domain-containing protein [Paenibacillus qinlingensis]MDR6550666.1 hypothetical protein [Paenibacillus qinlingensis]